MRTVIWSEDAIVSIQPIYDFIHLKSPHNAENVS